MPYVKELESIILNRKSIRNYDNTKIITDSKINDILNYVRHTPSAYGLEPWKILVISNPKIKKELQPIINNQEQVSSCSHLFILLSYSGETFNTSNDWFMKTVMKNRNLTKVQYETYKLTFNNFFDVEQKVQISHWAQCQTFILLQNLLLLLTAHEIDNVVLGGFNKKLLLQFLETNKLIEPHKYHVAVLVCAGYGHSSKTKIIKREPDEISAIIK
ncbi:nitroreductase family protein [Spiroplasma sp. AdecLV25b]|uniref:nitroreductase family protein n=1 Tax=Spiroplasma sp. AdecLV25b TaxID=3027162 RepID=UPI0027DF7A69|nr:nitroreductase family protein [Spiroplasma sp. AdecLV25b]